ncbi:hypothetical protein [Billgrantia kenyensis]|jgi:predicted peroxiredoxin|uniref:Peroxiredoxin n=1 Tax=Billgrantia kenyensis TaxID=321266 RepID=A0A7V9VZS9_9GAMM|nr:hypothetical protein [Halomonas kenyensis]MBA2778438.1 hypothetical protein [Halomonas kenyensis]MCG6660744.1 hypothetical protein [Halomonas kenyensis]
MSIKTTLTLAATATAVALSGAALADSHGGEDHAYDDMAERALVILTSDSLQTQGMAMILSNAMQQQGAELSILLCDAAGDLAIEGYASAEPINTPPENPAGQVTPEGILQMLMDNGAQVEVCAIYLPNSEHEQEDLREGVGVAAPGPMAEMMRDPKIPVFSF